MVYLSMVFFQVVAPILIMLGIGASLQLKFQFNLKALSNLITYCLMPAAVFINIYETKVNAGVLGHIILYLLIFSVSLMLLGAIVSKLLKLNRNQAAIYKNSVVLINSGNYGIPVSQMLFAANPLGTSIQIIIVIFQNVITYTYGLYNLISSTKSGLDILRSLLRLPIVHALIVGALMNIFNIGIPIFLRIPLDYLANAFISIALITLGAQLAQLDIKTILNKVILTSTIGRLVIGPVLAFGLILLMGFDGVVAQSLFIASAFPTSRNSSTLALEYDVEANLAAQIVLFSTVVSCITVTIVIYLSNILWG
ncbi:AEC family transporter [Psychrobacillus sp. NEAU-3TGS]|uniref:AEC family transporter n=1 Tax=Psychrobacillus sp. NEAU-3TGS TaxID=2995412 RepID=UPI002497EDCE|nr:AEC family transporter [Psychrobacillus sp. NEAU-3TGS]MDI2585635.1 AEC family transporter [Psychrobacillus sp. NEAU-3TGS]